MDYDKEILNRLEAKFWDFPTDVDEMRITSYDVNDNPLVVEYYFSNKLRFKHILTYDGSGRITIKQLIRF
jgi:hypothetical protein